MNKINKTGKNSGVTALWALVIIAGMVAAIFVYGQVSQNQLGEDNKPITTPLKCTESTATMSFNARNALQTGSSISASYQVKVNGGAPKTISGNSSTFTVGDKLQIFSGATDAIDTITNDVVVNCGGSTIDLPMYATDTKNLQIFNDLGQLMSDSSTGGTTNQSNIAAGSTLIDKMRITGTDLQSSGNLIVVVEAGQAQNITSITLSGIGVPDGKKVATPTSYVPALTNGKVQAFEIPAVVGAKVVEYSLGFQLQSGYDLSGRVSVEVYSEQAYVETDGTFKEGIENSLGATKYEDNYDYDFWVSP